MGSFQAQNAPKHVVGWGSISDPTGGAYDAPPDPAVGWGRGHPLPIPLPLVIFGASNVAPPTDPSFSFSKVGMSEGWMGGDLTYVMF